MSSASKADSHNLFGPQAPGDLVPTVPALHGVLGVENDHPAVHRPQHRFQVKTIAGSLLGLDAQLLVDRLHLLVAGTGLLVQRLQLLVGRLEFLIGGLQFLVGRLELFVGGLQLLVGRLQLLNGVLQALLGRLEFALQHVAVGGVGEGQQHGVRRAIGAVSGRTSMVRRIVSVPDSRYS
jgi:hypothetical protein